MRCFGAARRVFLNGWIRGHLRGNFPPAEGVGGRPESGCRWWAGSAISDVASPAPTPALLVANAREASVLAELIVVNRIHNHVRGPRLFTAAGGHGATSRARAARCDTSWQPWRRPSAHVRPRGRMADSLLGLHGKDTVASLQTQPIRHALRYGRTDGVASPAQCDLLGHGRSVAQTATATSPA